MYDGQHHRLQTLSVKAQKKSFAPSLEQFYFQKKISLISTEENRFNCKRKCQALNELRSAILKICVLKSRYGNYRRAMKKNNSELETPKRANSNYAFVRSNLPSK